MPRVPIVSQDDWNGVQLPSVMSVDASPIARGGEALGSSLVQLGGALAGVAQKIKDRKDQDGARDILASYDDTTYGVWNGRPGDDPRAEPVRGVKDWGEGDGSAIEAIKQAHSEWRDNPDGPYRKASDGARRLAERELESRSNRMFSLAAQKDIDQDDARRRTAAEASLATAARAVQMYAYDDDLFAGAAGEAADAAARLKLGRMITNPGERDPERLTFATEDGKTLYSAARADAVDTLRHGRARTLIAGAGTAESEGEASGRMAMAERAAEDLPPALRADALAALESARAKRLDGMLGLARAEADLDKQERFVTIAERAAVDYGAGGKLLGAVADEARVIRGRAQTEENHTALAALAEGRGYEPGENARMQAALKWAQPKYDAAVSRGLAKTLTGNKEFLGAMIGAGAWPDGEGGLRALSVDERRELLRAQLAAGNITIPAYQAQKTTLDKVEASGHKVRYERISTEVCAALGTEIETLWTDAGAVLKGKEDPLRKISDYETPDTKTELVPERKQVRTYVGLQQLGAPSHVSLETGAQVERTTHIKRKRELLAADVAKVINLLVTADAADGLMLDLDGNPSTPAVRMDARAYKAGLLADIKARQLAVDIDTQAEIMAGALSERRRDQSILEARAITKNAALRLPSASAREDGGAREEDDAD